MVENIFGESCVKDVISGYKIWNQVIASEVTVLVAHRMGISDTNKDCQWSDGLRVTGSEADKHLLLTVP
jgi:hypothetical protein